MGNVNEPKVGDTFFVVEDGYNSGRYAKNNNLPYRAFEAEVTKVGNKFFYLQRVDGVAEIKVEIGKTWEYSSSCKDYSIWPDKAIYEASKYREDLISHIRSFHQGYGDIYKEISTEDIVAIAKILKIEV